MLTGYALIFSGTKLTLNQYEDLLKWLTLKKQRKKGRDGM